MRHEREGGGGGVGGNLLSLLRPSRLLSLNSSSSTDSSALRRKPATTTYSYRAQTACTAESAEYVPCDMGLSNYWCSVLLCSSYSRTHSVTWDAKTTIIVLSAAVQQYKYVYRADLLITYSSCYTERGACFELRSSVYHIFIVSQGKESLSCDKRAHKKTTTTSDTRF